MSNWSPPGDGYPVRYWRLRIQFQYLSNLDAPVNVGELPAHAPLSLLAPLLLAAALSAGDRACGAASSRALRMVERAGAARRLVARQSRYVQLDRNPPALCEACGRKMAAAGSARSAPLAVLRTEKRLVVMHSACCREAQG